MQADGIKVARCTIERLMKQHGLKGVWSGKGKITTNSRDDQKRADDLVNRNFNAHRPNQLWVADFNYIKTTSGWVYTAFIIDVFARVIVSWKVSNRINTDMVMVALNQALAGRNKPKDLIHHAIEGCSIYPFATPIKSLNRTLLPLLVQTVIHTTMPWLRRSMGFTSLR